MNKAIVIGAGFSGLSCASFLAKAGWQVLVLEKHEIPGGRARKFNADGFQFDMGPSWYWMPDIFDRYFESFGTKTKEHYELERLNPSYRIYFDDGPMDVPADYEELKRLFESIEPGAAQNLDAFLKEAAYKYKVGIGNLVFKPGQSITEFFDKDVALGVLRLDVFTSMKKHLRKYFRHRKLLQLMEFPVLFLGALPEKIPALYSLMNYADIKLGTWYPKGGMYKIVEAMHKVAVSQGAEFLFNRNVVGMNFRDDKIESVIAEDSKGHREEFVGDVVIGSADYHFVESTLLPQQFRSYPGSWWQKKMLAPSCMIFYVGLNKKLKNVLHHSLCFDVNFDKHAAEIYSDPSWPASPLFYVSATSVTDDSVAPTGCENLFFLIPVAAGLAENNPGLREQYFNLVVKRFEQMTGEEIMDAVIYKRSYAGKEFEMDYNAFKGNAYGLANTLMQTAILKPAIRSKKLSNLFYTGQLTVPGPGVPPSLISGEIVAREVIKTFGSN